MKILFIAFSYLSLFSVSAFCSNASFNSVCTTEKGHSDCTHSQNESSWAVLRDGRILQCFKFKIVYDSQRGGYVGEPKQESAAHDAAAAASQKLESVGVCYYLGERDN